MTRRLLMKMLALSFFNNALFANISLGVEPPTVDLSAQQKKTIDEKTVDEKVEKFSKELDHLYKDSSPLTPEEKEKENNDIKNNVKDTLKSKGYKLQAPQGFRLIS